MEERGRVWAAWREGLTWRRRGLHERVDYGETGGVTLRGGSDMDVIG